MSLAGVNWDVFKVPLGFVRVVQLPLVIIAFASACSFGVTIHYTSTLKATGCEQQTINFGYPFWMAEKISSASCNKTIGKEVGLFSTDYGSPAQFYVFIGVITFLYILFSAFIYAMRWDNYEQDPRYAKILCQPSFWRFKGRVEDCVVTGVLAVCWVCGWIAWAAATTAIRSGTSPETIRELVSDRDTSCPKLAEGVDDKCVLDPKSWNYGNIIISALAGFGMVVAMIGNLWFVYKETEWFKLRQSATDINQIPGQTTPGSPPQNGQNPFPASTSYNN